jgi:hypothetical protein
MLSSTLFVRVVPADKDRGYILLAGYDASIVQRTAMAYTTLGDPTRASLNAAIERMGQQHKAAEVKDVTAPSIQKKLAKMFGEVADKPAKAPKQGSSAPGTNFAGLGVGTYLPDAPF